MTIILKKKKTMSVSVLSLKSSIWIQVPLYRYRPSYFKQHPVSDTWVPSFAVVPIFLLKACTIVGATQKRI